MITIAIGNLKGGVGTTTLAVSLAAFLQDAGLDLVLVDRGAGASASRWIRRRQDSGRGTIATQTSSPAGTLGNDRASYTVVDAGATRESVLPLLTSVDIWLAPTPPTFLEFTATLMLFNLWREARQGQRKAGLFATVITRVAPNDCDLERSARKKLSCAGNEMLVLNQALTRHAAWDATYDGHAVHELSSNTSKKALGQFRAVVVELLASALLKRVGASHELTAQCELHESVGFYD